MLIRDATVHTMTAAGTLEHTDILISDGKIAEIGHGLNAPANAEIIAAGGRPVTPGLFGGIGHLGIEEIGEEPTVDDYALKLGSMRPEFDVTAAFNPDSVVLGVNRIGGITFAMLAPSAEAGGKGSSSTIIAGQGSMARLDGTLEPAGARPLRRCRGRRQRALRRHAGQRNSCCYNRRSPRSARRSRFFRATPDC